MRAKGASGCNGDKITSARLGLGWWPGWVGEMWRRWIVVGQRAGRSTCHSPFPLFCRVASGWTWADAADPQGDQIYTEVRVSRSVQSLMSTTLDEESCAASSGNPIQVDHFTICPVDGPTWKRGMDIGPDFRLVTDGLEFGTGVLGRERPGQRFTHLQSVTSQSCLTHSVHYLECTCCEVRVLAPAGKMNHSGGSASRAVCPRQSRTRCLTDHVHDFVSAQPSSSHHRSSHNSSF